jgi:MscS family membrane protein
MRTKAVFQCFLFVVAVFSADPSIADTGGRDALRSADASSPRATLRSFTESMDAAYGGVRDILNAYTFSNRLYFNEKENEKLIKVQQDWRRAMRCLDISEVSPILKDILPFERIIQLKEILDRIETPEYQAVPDRQTMTQAAVKQWALPGTEINIVLIEDGPRKGEYLLSAETISRLPDYFDLVKSLPYKPGPGKQLVASYDALTTGVSNNIYQMIMNSPRGVTEFFPPRWMFALPGWATWRIASVSVWQWLGLSLAIIAALILIILIRKLGGRLIRQKDNNGGSDWYRLLTLFTIIFLAAFGLPLVTQFLHIGGNALVVMAFVLTATLFLSAAWACLIGGSILGQSIVASRHLRRRSLDSQLVKLGSRFIGFIVAIGLLIQGANQLGFPAYSVLAGLGVGGLAVALAARDTLANFLGSVVIMFEKPFRIGQWIKIGESEGIVEDVGFRSTRIRTFYNSLISIPNNEIVNASIDNLGRRTMRRQRFFVQITYDTPREKVEQFVDGLKQLIIDQPMADKSNFHVRFNKIGESGLDILLYFYLLVPDYVTELEERERILLQILDIAKEVGVEFAFPTRTLHIDGIPDSGIASSQEEATNHDRKPIQSAS